MSSKSVSHAAFDLARFLPYLLNQAAERVGKDFEPAYRDTHGFSRTQWRILAHLGAHGPMTAAAVSRRAQTEKSKISRAVTGLVDRALITRTADRTDRRVEILDLTAAGRDVHADIATQAAAFDRAIRQRLGPEDADVLERLLRNLAIAAD